MRQTTSLLSVGAGWLAISKLLIVQTRKKKLEKDDKKLSNCNTNQIFIFIFLTILMNLLFIDTSKKFLVK